MKIVAVHIQKDIGKSNALGSEVDHRTSVTMTPAIGSPLVASYPQLSDEPKRDSPPAAILAKTDSLIRRQPSD